ncbi:MAG: hypothetical protein KGY81_06145, partial [Phycisphaerae bacterium]|nr:hypothetical protein [Phycisphaerae bacterium]
MTTTTTLLWVLVSLRLAMAQPAGPIVLAATLPQATMSALQAGDGAVGASAFPGGMVYQSDGKVISVAMGLAPKGHPRAALMAKRAAYLVAVRNAGLYLAGWQCDADGR